MANKKVKGLRLRKVKVNTKEESGKVSGHDANPKASGTCYTCQNPRWNKTPRNT